MKLYNPVNTTVFIVTPFFYPKIVPLKTLNSVFCGLFREERSEAVFNMLNMCTNTGTRNTERLAAALGCSRFPSWFIRQHQNVYDWTRLCSILLTNNVYWIVFNTEHNKQVTSFLISVLLLNRTTTVQCITSKSIISKTHLKYQK